MVFRTKDKEYCCATALEIVRSLKTDAQNYESAGRPIRDFLLWSLNNFGDRIPTRELDLSDRIDDETLALSYLYLCDEYGVGRLFEEPAYSKSSENAA